MIKGETPEFNLHKLLRIVWVFLENCECEGVNADKWQLPEKYEQNHVIEEKEVTTEKGKKRKEEHILLKKEDAVKALESIYGILSEPWPFSNPCPGARPKYRV